MTMPAPPPLRRAPFTDAVLARLAASGKQVGDGQIPEGANWIGQPFLPTSVFQPYLVVSEIVASHSSGPFSDSQADWQLPYLVESFGISREACSWMADAARQLLTGLVTHTFTIDGNTYGMQQVRIDSIGEPIRVNAVYPPVWHSQDGFTLWIGKGA
jgi:hypothetical protein